MKERKMNKNKKFIKKEKEKNHNVKEREYSNENVKMIQQGNCVRPVFRLKDVP